MGKNISIFQWLCRLIPFIKNKNIRSKTIFIWNNNFSKVNSLFETLIDKDQLKALKKIHLTTFLLKI